MRPGSKYTELRHKVAEITSGPFYCNNFDLSTRFYPNTHSKHAILPIIFLRDQEEIETYYIEVESNNQISNVKSILLQAGLKRYRISDYRDAIEMAETKENLLRYKISNLVQSKLEEESAQKAGRKITGINPYNFKPEKTALHAYDFVINSPEDNSVNKTTKKPKILTQDFVSKKDWSIDELGLLYDPEKPWSDDEIKLIKRIRNEEIKRIISEGKIEDKLTAIKTIVDHNLERGQTIVPTSIKPATAGAEKKKTT